MGSGREAVLYEPTVLFESPLESWYWRMSLYDQDAELLHPDTPSYLANADLCLAHARIIEDSTLVTSSKKSSFTTKELHALEEIVDSSRGS